MVAVLEGAKPVVKAVVVGVMAVARRMKNFMVACDEG